MHTLEISLLFIGIEEVNDKETGNKAIPKRPIVGIPESKLDMAKSMGLVSKSEYGGIYIY